MTFKLTNENYFSKDRPHVSNSHVGDYLKSPAYYKSKHIDKLTSFKVTEAMKKGSVVDALLTQPGNFPYEVKLKPKPLFKRTCKASEDKELYKLQTAALEDSKVAKAERDQEIAQQLERCGADNLVTYTNWNQAHTLAAYISSQPFWQEGLETATFQQVLEGEIAGVLVCGLPDRIDCLGDGKWRITDLKCVAAMKISSPQKWMYNAIDMGYIRQAAIYRRLWAQLQGIPEKDVQFAHAVGSYVQDGLCKVELYEIPESFMAHAMIEIEWALTEIREGNFTERPITWAALQQLPFTLELDQEDDDFEGDLTDE